MHLNILISLSPVDLVTIYAIGVFLIFLFTIFIVLFFFVFAIHFNTNLTVAICFQLAVCDRTVASESSAMQGVRNCADNTDNNLLTVVLLFNVPNIPFEQRLILIPLQLLRENTDSIDRIRRQVVGSLILVENKVFRQGYEKSRNV